jgi:hypothetical protein
MRPDMSHVIVERPRLRDGRTRKGRPRPADDLPHHEGMRRPHIVGGSAKRLNENLAPLRRYLERQIGRPWDQVYSEISVCLRADNAVQQHVRDHLRDFVAVTPRRLARTWRSTGASWHQRFYVDPEDGILKRTDALPEEKAHRRARPQRAAAPSDRLSLAPDRELRQIAGLWYEVQLAEMPEPDYRAAEQVRKVPLKGAWRRDGPIVVFEMTVRRLVTPAVRDLVSGQAVPVGPEIDERRAWENYRAMHFDRRYAVAKRRLSSAEMRRHGVQDQSPEVSV